MKRITPLLIVALCFSAMAFAQTKSSLNLKKGQKYSVESKVETTGSTEVPGQTIDTKVNITTNYNIEVKDKTGNYHLINTISGMKMNMSMMGQEMNFDSDNQTDMSSQTGEALKGYIKQAKDVEMDDQGNIVLKASDDSASTGNNPLASQLKSLESTGYGAEFAFQSLPKDLKVGTKWSDKTSAAGISKSTDFVVKEINGNIATVALSGTLTTEMSAEQQGMEVKTKISGTFTGEEKVDITSGVILSNTSVSDQKGTVEAMGQEMPTTSKATTTTTVKVL
ncbi:MAG: DUF6263 family protein [Ginsengibacter sp.]